MAQIEIRNFSFTYPGEKMKALCDAGLSVGQGDFVLLCGPSGSGKTTLLRNLKKEISPAGLKTGSIYYNGIQLSELDERLSAREIGMVFQDPESQMVMDTVIDELAFSLENFGAGTADITKRISEMVTFFGLADCLHKPVNELSGGQKQIINLCSVLLLEPKLLLLDEPTSQLDPVSAHELVKMIYQINRELSVTVLISEHRLERLLPIADKVLYMEDGYVRYYDSPQEISKKIMKAGDARAAKFLPGITRLYFHMQKAYAVSPDCRIPLDVREGKRFVKENEFVFLKAAGSKLKPVNECIKSRKSCGPILKCDEISYRYDREQPLVLKKLVLSIYEGEFTAILGGNGAGKTTLLKAMAGLTVPQKGHVYFGKSRIESIRQKERYERIGYVAQNPLLHFTFDTVDGELRFMAKRVPQNRYGEKLEEITGLFGLENLHHRHPYDLSAGQQQKLAIACALIPGPEILMIDEPTKGLDPASKEDLALLLMRLKENGLTIITVTHDIEFAALYADKCAMLFDGSITECSRPAEFFGGNYFYTTVINRVVKEYLPSAITFEDVVKACGIQRN